MAGCNKAEAQASIKKNLMKRLRKENPTVSAADIRVMANEASEAIVAKVTTNVTADLTPVVSPAVLRNASTVTVNPVFNMQDPSNDNAYTNGSPYIKETFGLSMNELLHPNGAFMGKHERKLPKRTRKDNAEEYASKMAPTDNKVRNLLNAILAATGDKRVTLQDDITVNTDGSIDWGYIVPNSDEATGKQMATMRASEFQDLYSRFPEVADDAVGVIPEHAVSEPVLSLAEAFTTVPSKEAASALLNAEIAAGIRNANGDLIVNPILPRKIRNQEELIQEVDAEQAAQIAEGKELEDVMGIGTELATVLGSSQLEVPLTEAEITEFYYDEDGSMSNARNVNNALKELDKKNFGAEHDTAWSAQLDLILGNITDLVGDISKAELKIKKTTLQKAAQGQYDPNTGEIEVKLDNLGNGQGFRNRFTMSNQEVYLHELVHSIVDYAFEEKNLKAGSNTELVSLISESKRLYTLARKYSTWEDMLVGIKNPTAHEVAQAKERYEYIFSNPYGNGLHEFMAHLLTNQQFGEAMNQIEAGVASKDPRTLAKKKADFKAGKTLKLEEETDTVTKILDFFRGLLNKVLGMATARDGSITESGSKLILNIMQANKRAADKAAAKQRLAVPAKAAKFIEKQLTKVGNQFDKADKALQEPIDKVFKAVLAQKDTRSAKARFDKEYKFQKASFFRKHKATTVAKRNALETQADIYATKEAEQVIADEAVKIAAKIKDLTEKISKETANKEDRAPSKVYGVEAIKSLSGIPTKLNLLMKLHKVSRGVYGEDLSEAFATQYKTLAEEMNFYQDSFLASVMDDFYDKDGLYNDITDAILSLTQSVDGYREKMYEDVLAQTKDWFGDVDIHSKENKHYDAAMSDTILRTDLQALGIDAKGLLGLLKNPDSVTTKIKALSAKVSPQQVKDAKSTASAMINGVGTISNAANIAKGFGHGNVNQGTPDAQLVKDIDELISLIALDRTDVKAKKTMSEFLAGDGYDVYTATLEKRLGSKFRLKAANKVSRADYQAQVMSGVNNFISYSRGMQEASRLEMEEEPHNTIKGYMKETYSHDIEVAFFPIDQIKEKEREGYTFVREVGKQTASGPKHGLFTIRNNAVKRANGALGLQGTKQRGTTLADIVNRDNPVADTKQKDVIFRAEMAKAKARFAAGDEKLGMYPVYNKIGSIVNFRSSMSVQEKSELLDMESRGTQNLARSFGTSSTAKKTARHNKMVLTRIYKDYMENSADMPKEYVTIEPELVDAMEAYGIESNVEDDTEAQGYARMWARLPKATKQAAAELWGEVDADGKAKGGKIIVRKDLLIPLFGYDELSMTDMEMADKWSTNTRKNAKQFEKIFMDIMQIAKGNIVVKTTDVLIGNITSNAKILGYIGVNPVKGFKMLMLGQKELQRYEADMRELSKLKRDVLAGLPVSERRMEELEDETKNNSVAPLIEAGLYQSVVEDVSTKTDNNRVSNWFNDKRDQYVPNETANTAIQYMFLTEKTKPFQAMLKATQVSDFYFRYAQYHDAIQNKGVTKKQALRDATDNYINYEAPLNKFIRYGDRMGPFFFITYFTRIQRVIKRIVKKNPARVAADITQQFIFSDQDDILDQSVLDASILGHYNPFKVFNNLWQAISPSGLEFVGVADR